MSGPQTQNYPQPSNSEELVQVLAKLAGHATSTEEIQMATGILKQFLKQKECVAPLMAQINNHPDGGIRQIAAVLLRRKIAGHYKKLDQPVQESIKKTLLDRLVTEELRMVRLSVAALISSLAKKLVPDNKWPELLTFLLQCSESQTNEHREVSMLLFRALAETIGDCLRPHFDTLLNIFVRGLSDSSPTVRTEALKAMGVLAEDQMDDENACQKISDLIPLMVNAIKQCLLEGNEDAASSAFETFDNLAESPVPVIVPHLPIVVSLMAEITANRNMSMNTRDKASLFIAQVCENKPGKLVKCGLVAPLLEMCFNLAVEPFEGGDEDMFESQELTAQRIAVEILDGLALNTPKRFIYEQSMPKMMALLQDADPNKRKGALVVLAVLTEGLSELLKPDMANLLQLIIKHTTDPSQIVRAAAAVGITQFSDFLQPEIMDCHGMVMPCIFQMLDHPGQAASVYNRALDALDSFCERLGPEIELYVQDAMARLARVMTTANQSQEIQEKSISAIRSVARSAEDKFSPFFMDTIQVMAGLMTRNEDEMLGLRSAATECVGAIACAVGKEKFAPFLQDAIKLAIQGTTLNHFQLREATHNFFQSLCTMLGPEFTPLLTSVMPLLLAACESDDGVVREQVDDGFGGRGGGDISDPDGDDEEDDGLRHRYMIRSGALDEKIAAVSCLGTIATSVGEAFMPYLDKTLEALFTLTDYPHYYIRSAVFQTLAEIIGLLHTCYPNPQKWQAGVAVPLHPTADAVMAQIVPTLVQTLYTECHKGVASAAVQALIEACKKFGPGVIAGDLEDLNVIVLDLIMEKTPCQLEYDDDDPERADHDGVLIDDVTSLVGVLAQLYGPGYDEVFQKMYPSLMKFCKEHRPSEDRLMTIGCIAEVAEAVGDKICKYMDDVFPLVFACLSDPSSHVRRNSAFCLGALCAAAGPQLHSQYGRCLQALQPLFNVPADLDKYEKERVILAKDNATSVLAKMIAAGANALPMQEVVPVLLANCPLTADLEEAKYVYPVVCELFTSHTQLMMTHLNAAVDAIAGAFVLADMLEEETRQGLVAFAKQLHTQLGAKLEGIVGGLVDERKNAFIAAVQS